MSPRSGRPAISTIRTQALGVLCGLVAAAIWGGGAVVSRFLVTSGLSPADLTLLRYVGCFPVALGMLIAMGSRLQLKVGWRRLLALVMLGGPLYHALVVAGYQFASAGGGALLLAGLLPIFALGLGFAMSSAKPSPAKLGGALSVLAGLASFGIGAGSTVTLTGIGVFAIGAGAWAVLNEAVRRWQVDPLQLTVALILFAPAFTPIYLLTGSTQAFAAPASELLLQVAYHGWLVSIGATGLFFASVRLAGPQAAAALQATSAGFSAILGAAILGEPLMPAQIGGLALVTAGLLLSLPYLSPALTRVAQAVRTISSGRGLRVGLSPRLKPGRWP